MGRVTPSDLWQSPVILKRLAQEAGFECQWGQPEKAHYWCMAPHSDSATGAITLRNYEKDLRNCDPHELQQTLVANILAGLMLNYDFDGLWLVGFTHPPTTYEVITDTGNAWGRLIMIWHDEQGDPQYTAESDKPLTEMLGRGHDYYVEMATKAHAQWKEMYGAKAMKSDFMLKASQVHNPAMEALKK